MKTQILIIDHLDSFTYNLYHYLGEIGLEHKIEMEIAVIRTDQKSLTNKKDPTHVILSPGYGHPREVKLFHQAIKKWRGKIPILGVCLGHQAIAMTHGAKVEVSPIIMHGKSSLIRHYGQGIFTGLENPFEAGRYHSLIANKTDCEVRGLKIIAYTDQNEVMGIESQKYPNLFGVQFHPESILTPSGKKLLFNFLKLK